MFISFSIKSSLSFLPLPFYAYFRKIAYLSIFPFFIHFLLFYSCVLPDFLHHFPSIFFPLSPPKGYFIPRLFIHFPHLFSPFLHWLFFLSLQRFLRLSSHNFPSSRCVVFFIVFYIGVIISRQDYYCCLFYVFFLSFTFPLMATSFTYISH